MARGMRPDRLGAAGPAGDAADDPPGAMAVHPPTVGTKEYRPFAALADGQVDRPGGTRRERDGDDLAALARDHQSTVAAFGAQGLDVRAGRLGHPQPVQREQGYQGVLDSCAEPGGD